MFWLHNVWAAVSVKYWLLHLEDAEDAWMHFNGIKEKRGLFEEGKLAVGLDYLSMLLKFVDLILYALVHKQEQNKKCFKVVIVKRFPVSP